MVNVTDIARILESSAFTVDDRATIPAREASYAPVPAGLEASLAERLSLLFPQGLYSHQSVAIAQSISGSDVCLATSTASGKSLVFMAAAADACLRDRSARVLALYPAKALIQDQLTKWMEFLQPLGLSVGFIDGSVPVRQRGNVLVASRIVAMTPDVAHAWLMSHLAEEPVRAFMARVQLLVLDEAHVYDGVFGTNMAYFLRRFAAASRSHRMICSTATVGEPAAFMKQLTGRDMAVVDGASDGSGTAQKTLLVSASTGKDSFDKTVELLARLSEYGKARFLAFGDSRKAVERIVAAVLRQRNPPTATAVDDGEDGEEPEELPEEVPGLVNVLPYRAGYEAEDRAAIQSALSQGTLSGVVSTSALELGLDIGDLDVVVLLNTPSTVKAFRQRIGRAGRRGEAVCVLLDDRGTMTPLSAYLERKPEPSWLYLENRFIQYAHALCAAAEFQASGMSLDLATGIDSLPATFARQVANEVNPVDAIPPDLYTLKQLAQDNPHYEFPIRSAAEANLKVEGPFNKSLGELSYSQLLREAYPGAVYYYMARPYRVQSVDVRKRLVRAGHSRFLTTKPQTETAAFPDFLNGALQAWSCDQGFVCEVELQVSQRVKGFVEQRGQTQLPHEYGPHSPYNQRPLTRFFRTTGVAWSFPTLPRTEAVGEAILRSFCTTCGVHDRELGFSFFKVNHSLTSAEPSSGTVIFDATNGSLRLTERLAERFSEIVDAAVEAEINDGVRRDLTALQEQLSGLAPRTVTTSGEVPASDSDWVHVIAPGSSAMYADAKGPVEVTVLGYRYTPQGLLYHLENLAGPGSDIAADGRILPRQPAKWMVVASALQPLNGQTAMMRVNLVTGEEELPDATSTAPDATDVD